MAEFGLYGQLIKGTEDDSVSSELLAVPPHDGTKTYGVGNIASELAAGVLSMWIVWNAALANVNAPTHSAEPADTGWELLTERAAWRGLAPAISTYYHAGDSINLTNQTVLLCVLAGSYTATEIAASANWRSLANQLNIRSGDDDPQDTTGADGDWYIQTTTGAWFFKASGAWGEAQYTPVTLDAVLTATDVINGANGIPVAGSNPRRLLYNPANDRLEISANHPHNSTIPIGTWVDAPDRTDLFIANDIFNDVQAAENDFAYDTHYKHFYEFSLVYQGGGAGLEWVQTSPTIALALSRSVGTYSIRFLGERDSDEDATLQVGTLAADTDYFYIRGLELRRLTLNTYTAPGEIVDHWIWEAVSPVNRIIDGRKGVPLASAAYDRRFLYNPAADRVEVCINHPSFNTDPTGTWADAPARTDLVIDQLYESLDPGTPNDYAYVVEKGHFYQWLPETVLGTTFYFWQQVTPTQALAASRSNTAYAIVFLGERDTDAEAILRITSLAADTDYFFINDARQLRRLDRASYVAPIVADHWAWEPVIDFRVFFGDLEELTQQPAITDEVMVLDRDAGRLKSLAIENLGIFIRPDSTGHMPTPNDAIIASGLPGILRGRLLEPTRTLMGAHGASAAWGEISAERINTVWTPGTQVAVGALYQYDGWGWRCLVAHLTDVNDPPTGDDINWERLSLGGTESLPPIWTTAIEWSVGERARSEAESGTSIYICTVAHRSTLQNILGDTQYWASYTLKTVDANFRGVFTRRPDVPNPEIGDWAYFDIGGDVFAERYGANGWELWGPLSIHAFLGRFSGEANALAAIHFYSSSTTTAAVYSVGGRQYLFVLVSWTAPVAGTVKYDWQPSARDDVLVDYFFGGPQVPTEIGELSLALTAQTLTVTLTQNSPSRIGMGDGLIIGGIEWVLVTSVLSQRRFTVKRGFRETLAVEHDVDVIVQVDGYGPGEVHTRTGWGYSITQNTCWFDLGKAIGPADYDKDLAIQVRCYDGNKWVTFPQSAIKAQAFALLENHIGSGTSVDNTFGFAVAGGANNSLNSDIKQLLMFARHRITFSEAALGLGQEGHDALLMAIGSPGDPELYKVQVQITLFQR